MKQHTNTPQHSFKLKAITFLIGLAETQRLVDEEGRSGGRSGLGSGKGAAYYAKVDADEQAVTSNTVAQEDFKAFEVQVTRSR